MRALLIGPTQKAAVQQVLDYAEAHRFPRAMLVAAMNAGKPILGDDRGFLCELPVGFRCAFSIEQHPAGWHRHLSVSVNVPGKLPPPPAMDAIMTLFGFRAAMSDAPYLYVEEGRAINVLEPLE